MLEIPKSGVYQNGEPHSGSAVRHSNRANNCSNCQPVSELSDRIQQIVLEKFHVEDIRQLTLQNVDEESEEEADLTPKHVEQRKIEKLFDVFSVVGAGGFGVVIACLDRSSNKKFALKIASQDQAQAATSLCREKVMLSGMRHPNIIRVYETR